MKEQPRYNKTPEQGWASMKPMLEEAMPVGKSRHRLPIYFWAATAIVVAGLLSIVLVNRNAFESNALNNTTGISESTQTINSNDSKAGSTNEAPSNESINEQEKVTNEIGTTEQNSGIAPIEKTILDRKTKAKESTPVGNKPSPKVEGASIPMASLDEQYKSQGFTVNSQGVPLNSQTQIAIAVDQNSLSGSAADIIALDSELAFVSMRNSKVFAPVATLPIPMLSESDRNDQMIFVNEAKKGKRIPVLLSPTLAVSTLLGQHGGLGVYGGAGVDLNISKRISLTTAIGYASYNPNANFLASGVSELSSNELESIVNFDPSNKELDSYVYSESINTSADYRSISPLIETISQWQVDIGLDWRFSRRFYASGGAKFGFSTKAISQYPIVSPDPSGIPSSPLVHVGNSLDGYDVIRNSNTSAYLGFGYRLGKHLDVFANWTHGFDQYVLNGESSYFADQLDSDRTDYIRGLSLGVKYSL